MAVDDLNLYNIFVATNTESIRQIVDKVNKKQVHLPDFQRPYKWGPKQVEEYITSIYRQHPTGHFLFWSTSIDKKEFNFLVDGQQRVTSLMYAFTGNLPSFFRGKEPNYKFFFNPVTEQFSRRIPSSTDPEHWINMIEFFANKNSLTEYIKKFNDMKSEEFDPSSAIQNITKFHTMYDYEYALDTLQPNIDMLTAVRIFNKINSSGTKLDDGDLAYATISVTWDEFKDKFTSFVEKMEDQGYEFKVYFYMRLLAVLANKSALLSSDFHSLTKKEIKDAWSKLEKILPKVLQIYSQRLYINKVSEFVSLSPIYILSVYLASQEKFNFKNEDDASNWMYYTLLAGLWQRYSGSGGDHKIDIDRKIAQDKDSSYDTVSRLVTNINEQTGYLEINSLQVRGSKASTSNGIFRTYIYMLKHQGATDWIDGTEFFPTKGESPTLHYHHIFPSKWESELESFNQETLYLDNIPNRVVLISKTNQSIGAEKPEDYLPKIKKTFPEALNQQNIPSNKSFWKLENFNDFVSNRTEAITKEINNFVASFDKTDSTKLITKLEDIKEEGTTVEFKESWGVHTKESEIPIKELKMDILKSVVAFANTQGGRIYIGIDDSGRTVGIGPDLEKIKAENKIDRLKNDITTMAYSNLKRGSKKSTGFNDDIIETVATNGETVLIISVDPILEDPPVTIGGVVYERIGATDQPVTTENLVPWMKDRFGV